MSAKNLCNRLIWLFNRLHKFYFSKKKSNMDLKHDNMYA